MATALVYCAPGCRRCRAGRTCVTLNVVQIAVRRAIRRVGRRNFPVRTTGRLQAALREVAREGRVRTSRVRSGWARAHR